jgi:hypothetical protein
MKILFVHIPRNGGTFVAANIAKNIGYEHAFGVDLENITLAHFDLYQDNIIRDYRFISGHIPMSILQNHIGEFDLILAVIRSPLQRAISYYSYVAKPQPEANSAVDIFENFLRVNYFDNINTRNEQCGYIGTKNLFSSVTDVLAEYPALRLLRFWKLEEDLKVVMQEFGMEFHADAYRNESAATLRHQRELITMDVYKEFRDWFSDDYLLFEMLGA